jgi:hypothetical protein
MACKHCGWDVMGTCDCTGAKKEARSTTIEIEELNQLRQSLADAQREKQKAEKYRAQRDELDRQNKKFRKQILESE